VKAKRVVRWLIGILCAFWGTGPAIGQIHLNIKSNSQPAPGNVVVAKGEMKTGDLVSRGNIDVEGSVTGDCVALGGSITINGGVTGDISSIGGPILINGSVTGDVASVGGDILLGPKAAVTGDVATGGGRLTKEKGAVVTGNINDRNTPLTGKALALMKWLNPIPAIIPNNNPPYTTTTTTTYSISKNLNFLPALDFSFSIVFFLAIGLIILLMAMILPKPVENIAGAIQGDFWKSAGIGLLILILFLPGLLVLCISIIGIALIPLVFILFGVAWLMSLAAFSLILTGRACDTLKRPPPSQIWGIVAGYFLLNSLVILGKLLGMAGIVGGVMGGILVFANGILFFCAWLVGLGAVWSTRLGSRPAVGITAPVIPTLVVPDLESVPTPALAPIPPVKRKKRSQTKGGKLFPRKKIRIKRKME
jgi:cytoskeletal protein CcmA (bactofilin family)